MKHLSAGNGNALLPLVRVWGPSLAAVAVLAGCGSETNERDELFAMVEVDYGRAIRVAQSQVSGGEVAAVDLKGPESQTPVWETEIVRQDGRTSTVRVDATSGEVRETASPRGRTAEERQESARLLREAELRAGQAARAAADPTDGRVTSIALQERKGEAVWSVEIVTVDENDVLTHQVDADSGKVLDRHRTAR